MLINMQLFIRPMCDEDIQQAAEIDKENFPTMQPPVNYKRELANELSYYIVAYLVKTDSEESRNIIIGFAGFWLMAGEAHIMNLAVRWAYQHRGIGELLLVSLLDLALRKDAEIITLEVRLSNQAAQKLYEKCGFKKRGIRRGYYLDNNEDAVIMTADDIRTKIFEGNVDMLRKKHQKKWKNMI
ncbi:MAG: ribosomal protein S18-alanine N-acetyltransferase [Dehalococcoidia bacterium]|nr:MAG: ribosomal protein S18-alanine N-acetyltransferase [Dehalococcoidia bacterium]